MIQKYFTQILEELEGLIKDDVWSAPRPLVAVSGGVDSMCLADLFLRTVGYDGFALAHCNFNLRGDESDGDEAMVREWALKRKVEANFVSFNTEEYAESNGISIEMAARELRYRWFASLCRSHGYRYVAVAHHADDNAETLILNLARGTGLKGASGMKSVSVLPYSEPSEGLKLMRPLLRFTRKQIEGYAFAVSLPYRTDSTNASVDYKRNRIRHEVFPVLEKLNPSFVRTFNRNMGYFADAEEIVSDWCRNAAEEIVTYNEDGSTDINVAKLMKFRQWRYLLFHVMEPMGFNSAVLASLEELLESDRTMSGKTFRSDTAVAVTGRGKITVLPSSLYDAPEQESLSVEGPGIYMLNGASFTVEMCQWSSGMQKVQPEGVLAFDASFLTFPFVCRQWKRGDWMVPLGMKGKKKISDLFSDMKMDEPAKKRAVIIVGEPEDSSGIQRVAGVLGLRMDSRYAITGKTDMIIRIKKN